MKGKRITIHEMKQQYPDEYLFLTDCIDDGIDIIEGVVLAHNPKIEEIDKISRNFKGDAAIWYTGKLIPEGTYLL